MEPGTRREKVVTTLLHDREYETVRDLAYLARKSVSAWLRDIALAEGRRERKRLDALRRETAA